MHGGEQEGHDGFPPQELASVNVNSLQVHRTCVEQQRPRATANRHIDVSAKDCNSEFCAFLDV